MVLSILVWIYSRKIEKAKKELGENAVILSDKQIQELFLGNINSKSIKLLKSAVIDHSEVDGLKYYTKNPYEVGDVLVNHDNYRKAEIAYGLGNVARKIPDDSIDDAVEILYNLTNHKEKIYVNTLAWNSLGEFVYRKPELFDEKIKEEFSQNVGNAIGGLLYINKYKKVHHEKASALMNEILANSKADVNALIYYYLRLNKIEHKDFNPSNNQVSKFINALKERYVFDQSDFNMGLKTIEIGNPPPPFWPTTAQYEVAKKLTSIAGHLIAAIGAFKNKNYLGDFEPARYDKYDTDNIIFRGKWRLETS